MTLPIKTFAALTGIMAMLLSNAHAIQGASATRMARPPVRLGLKAFQGMPANHLRAPGRWETLNPNRTFLLPLAAASHADRVNVARAESMANARPIQAFITVTHLQQATPLVKEAVSRRDWSRASGQLSAAFGEMSLSGKDSGSGVFAGQGAASTGDSSNGDPSNPGGSDGGKPRATKPGPVPFQSNFRFATHIPEYHEFALRRAFAQYPQVVRGFLAGLYAKKKGGALSKFNESKIIFEVFTSQHYAAPVAKVGETPQAITYTINIYDGQTKPSIATVVAHVHLGAGSEIKKLELIPETLSQQQGTVRPGDSSPLALKIVVTDIPVRKVGKLAVSVLQENSLRVANFARRFGASFEDIATYTVYFHSVNSRLGNKKLLI